jgi:hypothetical protein
MIWTFPLKAPLIIQVEYVGYAFIGIVPASFFAGKGIITEKIFFFLMQARTSSLSYGIVYWEQSAGQEGRFMVAGEGLTFEKVWEMFQETDRISRENERKWQETREQMKETDRKIGELGNRFGELAEHLVAPSIHKKFKELGFTFEQVSQNIVIDDARGLYYTEVDLLLENGEIVMVVEVKAKPTQKDVKDHIKRIEILRRRAADKRWDSRKFQGAIAGAIMTKTVRDYVHKTGFYAIEQTGDTVKICIPEGFKPREW